MTTRRTEDIDAGDIIAVPLPNGRVGAIWVVENQVDFKSIQFVVLDGFWDSVPPTPRSPKLAGYPYGKKNLLPDKADVWKGWFKNRLPKDFVVIGRVALPTAVRRHASAEGTFVFQNAEQFRDMLFQHWRSLFDSEALEAERKAALARYEREEARKAAARKATNSLSKMLREKPFAHWRGHWGMRPVTAVRKAFHTATAELIKLGKKAPRRSKIAVFHRLVDELNAIDDREGCIETGEREELVARIAELGELVGLRNTNEQLSGRRDW